MSERDPEGRAGSPVPVRGCRAPPEGAEAVIGSRAPRFSPEGVPGRVQQVEPPLRSPSRLRQGVDAVKAESVYFPTRTLRLPGCDPTVSGPSSPRLLSSPRSGVKEKIPPLPWLRIAVAGAP